MAPKRFFTAAIAILLFVVAGCSHQVEQIAANPPTAIPPKPTYTQIPQQAPTQVIPSEVPTMTMIPIPTDMPITEEDLALAEKGFAEGLVVYLIDVQPDTVSRAEMDTTYFTVRYMLSEDAKPVSNVIFTWRNGSDGTKEYAIADSGFISDWSSEIGSIQFGTFNMMREMIKSNQPDPNSLMLMGVVGMTSLYGQPNPTYVDDPVSLYIFLVGPEERDGQLFLSDATEMLSNAVKITITP